MITDDTLSSAEYLVLAIRKVPSNEERAVAKIGRARTVMLIAGRIFDHAKEELEVLEAMNGRLNGSDTVF